MDYSTVRVSRSVALIGVSGVAAISIRWKVELYGDEKETEPAEGRSAETWQVSAKASRSQRSGTERSDRR